MLKTILATAIAALALLGCSSDDADESAEASAETEEACAPAGGDAIEVVVDEWSIAPAAATAGPGTVTFEARNDGEEPHELVIVRAPSVEALEVVDGRVDEDAVGRDFIGEIEAFPAGERCAGSFELTAGDYVLFCNIVEEEGGERESHIENGMATTFTVA